MSTPASFVRKGFYADYGRRWGYQTQFLCSTFSATLWTNALGIVIAIAIARLFRLLLRLYRLRFQTRDTTHRTPEAILWHELLDWRQERREGAILLHGPRSDIRRDKGQGLIGISLNIILLIVSYIGILAFSTLTARLATEGTALSNHAACGLYEDPPIATDVDSNAAVTFRTETDSARLAERCFNAERGADGCNFFLSQSIPYETSRAPCPFQDRTMCVDERLHTIRFFTGPTSARVIGINSPTEMHFSRDTTCAPIVTNETFIMSETIGDMLFHTYHYGSTTHYNYSHATLDPRNDRLRPSRYRMGTKVTPGQWSPILALHPRVKAHVSIIFVNSQGVLFPEQSNDPIFPANNPFDLGFDIGTKYTRPDQIDRAFACVDINRWRLTGLSDKWYDASGQDETGKYFNPYILEDSTPQTRGALRLLMKSLHSSRMALSLQSRQENGLNATSLLQAGYSHRIAKDQWEREAKLMFESTLTRIQVEARNIVQGVPAEYGSQKIEQGSKEICDQTFMFRSQGFQNVHVAGFAWILACSLLVVFLAVPLDDDRLLAEGIWHSVRHSPQFVVQKWPSVYRVVNRWVWAVRDFASNIAAKLKPLR